MTETLPTRTPFHLETDPRFDAVKDVFTANFKEGAEHGAAFCVYEHGKLVIDLKGGWADRKKTRPITDETLFSVFSTGKAVASLIIAHLAEQDKLGYDGEVATLWPEFDQGGKGELTIAQVLSHQGGLSGITNDAFTGEDWYDWEHVCRELAAQEPIFKPATASGYSPVTFGFLAGEIARRADEFGRNLGDILQQDICGPHNLDVWLGLPESEHMRCADMQKPKRLADLGEINPATKAAFLQPWSSPRGRSLTEWRTAQLAGSNCQAGAKSLARLMQMAVDGTVDGGTYLSEDMLGQLRRPRMSGPDQVLPFDVTYAAGLLCNEPNYFYGPHAETVGHSGWGGSCTFADPITGLSAAYVMTRQDNSLIGDPRSLRLIEATYAALKP